MKTKKGKYKYLDISPIDVAEVLSAMPEFRGVGEAEINSRLVRLMGKNPSPALRDKILRQVGGLTAEQIERMFSHNEKATIAWQSENVEAPLPDFEAMGHRLIEHRENDETPMRAPDGGLEGCW